MADLKTKPDENIILGDTVEFLWLEYPDGEMYRLGQVEDERDNGKKLILAVYDDPSDTFEGNIPLFNVNWNETTGRYEGKKR